MRNVLIKFIKHRFNITASFRCPIQSFNMATNLQETEQKADEKTVDREEGQMVKTSTKRNRNDFEEFKAKRKKMEEVDGKIMQSRKELGLPYKKKKMAMIMMYCGKNYYGMQIQREDTKSKFDTIENDLFEALSKAGVILEEHVQDQKAIKFQRAARTDKGVSAAGQVCSLMMFTEVDDPVKKINSHLSSQIRILGIKRATKGFDSKNDCDYRTYSYLLPTFALCPIEENVVETFRVKDETLKRANEVLALYKGTHNFHNYTSGKKPSDPSAKRYIIDMQIGQPFVQDGLEFATINVKGQSFMLHQIRKMIGLMIAILRGLASVSAIQNSWRPVKTDVPKAPGLGLMLEQVHYDAHNKRFNKTHDKIDCKEYKDEIEVFKKEVIYSTMIETENTEKSMMNWLQTLHLHHFGEIQNPDYPITSETALGHAVRKVARAQQSLDESSANDTRPGSSSQGSEESAQEKSEQDNGNQSATNEKELNAAKESEERSQIADITVKSETSGSLGQP